MTLDPQRVEARKKARADADEVLELLSWPDNYGADYAETLLTTLKEKLPQRAVDIKPPEPVIPIARLGATVMEYGEFRDDSYDNIPLERLQWYLARAEENAKSLKAYLNHPELQARRGYDA